LSESNANNYQPSTARSVIPKVVGTSQLQADAESKERNQISGAPAFTLNDSGQCPLRFDTMTDAFLHAGQSSLPESQILNPSSSGRPLPEHMTADPHYDIDIASEVARIQFSVSPHSNLSRMEAITRHLNHTKNPGFTSSLLSIPPGDEWTPYIPHTVQEPFPIAMVNREPYGPPNHGDVYTPQNEAWLAGLRYAKKNVFIQSPTLNASPLLPAIIEACERGVDVFLFICLGYNDTVCLIQPMKKVVTETRRANSYLCKAVRTRWSHTPCIVPSRRKD